MDRMMRAAISAAALGACVLLAACKPARPLLDPTPLITTTAELNRADELVRAGCYVCLTQALAIYERLAAPPREVPSARFRAVDTALLLAIRERELGLGKGRWRQHAEELAREFPPPVDYSSYLAMTDTVGWKAAGVSSEQQDSFIGSYGLLNTNFLRWRAALLASAPSNLFSAYALVTLDCLYGSRFTKEPQKPFVLPNDAPPLLRFRAAYCPGAPAEDLDTVLKSEPRLKEANLFLGERALARGTLRTAERLFLASLEDIPDLMAAKFFLGFVALQMEDIETALSYYHEVTTAVPGHRDAMLGEAKSLSYLGRSPEAIVVLDEMVKLGTWNLGDAHYWLAWNRHRLKQFDLADDEVIAARKYLPMDPNVDKLAGFVALAKNDMERAEREFRAAVEHYAGRGARDCDANYYLASVLVALRKWPEGADRFTQAVPCYTKDEEATRVRIDEIKAADLPEERKVRLVAAKEKQIGALQAQQARSAYNGAVAYANLGDKEKARPLAERAAQHPEMADLAQKLLLRLQPGFRQ